MQISILPLKIIPIEDDGFHLMVEGFINKKPANFLVDTGASRTVFDQECIQRFINMAVFEDNGKLSTGLGTNAMPSQVTTIEQIQLGAIIIEDYQAVVLDLKHVHQSYTMLGLPIIHAVLGGDILKKSKAVINYRKKQLKLYA
jgi:clan AA aspartic protease (TIGR02281 family)